MKKLLTILICLLSVQITYSQCSEVPVKEAVRNGDFEEGYLPVGGATDFYSDMSFGGDRFSGTGDPRSCSCCQYGMGDQYVVARRDTFTCAGTKYEDNTMWGISYGGDAIFADHTPGLAGDGHALLVDLNGLRNSPKTGGLPIAWEQTVDVYSSESYFFSAWIANFSTGTAPVMQVTVIPELGGVASPPEVLPVSGATAGLMNWSQMTASWIPAGIYDKVTIRFEFVNVAGGSSGLDVAIDDISFINSCQEIAGANAYVTDFGLPDTINFCELGGDILLDPQVPVGQRANATVAWYEGDSDPQTEIDNGVWTKTFNTPGTYRVCVDDPDNGCPVSDQVTIIEEVSVDVPDIELCNPAEVTVDAGLDPNSAVSIDWSGPSGAASTRTYNVDTEGAHTLTLTGLDGHAGCSAVENFNVISNLPEPDEIEYCDGGGVDVDLTVPDGLSYRWATDEAMSDVIGTGTSVSYSIPGGTTGDQILWIQNSATSPLGTGGSTTFSGYPDGNYSITFTTTESVQLSSFDVFGQTWIGGCGGAGTTSDYTFTISGDASMDHTQTVNCTGSTSITPGFNLGPGTYTLTADKRLKFSASTINTSIGGGVVEITSSGKSMMGNLSFERSAACAPFPVTLKAIACCTAPTDDPSIDVPASTLTVCDPDNGEVVSVAGLTNGLDFKWQESTDGGTTWTDIAGETGDVAGGQITLTGVSDHENWYRFIIAEDGNLDKSCVKTSDSVQFIRNPLPVIDSIGKTPFKSIYCEGEAHELEAHVDETAGYPVTYAWTNAGTGTDSVTDGITTPGTHTYEVEVDAKGCKATLSIDVDVEANETADVTDDQGPFCVSETPSPIITTEAGTTPGGAWSVDDAVIATIDAGTGELTMLTDGTVRVYYQTAGACFGIDSVDIVIEPAMEVEVTTPDVTFCKKDTTFTVELTPTSSTGGRWTAWDVTNATFVPTAVDAAGNFDGSGLEPGDYIIKYAMDGFSAACSDSDSITVTINVLDTAEIINLPSVCNSDAAVNLQLNPAHVTTGTWYDSTGVNVGTYIDAAGLFDPQFGGGLPTGSVMVIFETDGSCAGRDTAYVTVTNNITYSMDHVQDEYCMNAANDFIAVSPGGGEFWTTSGVGIVDPATGEWDPKLYTAAGIDTIWYGKAGDCGDTVFLEVTLVAPDTADIDAVLPLCIDEPAFDLTASVNTTPGGTWSGAGITDGALGTFDALTAGPGDHKIKYTTAGTCPTVDSVQIIVRPRVVASIDSLQLAFCGVASEQVAVATPNNVAGFTIGRWEKSASWPADWDAGLSFDNDSTLRFDPTGRTVTTDTIFYIIDDNAAICGSADTLRIGISDMEIADIDTVEPVCADAGVVDFEFVAASGSVDGGVWRTDAPAGSMVDPAAGIFDPAIAGPGYYQIIYKTPGVCFVEDTTWLLVKPRVTVSLDQTSATQCAEGAAIEVSGSHDILIPLYDPTGTWFGSPTWPADWTAGLTVTGKDISIDPVNRVAGVDSIFYSIETNDTVCGDTIAFTLTIDALDIPDINGAGISAFCQTDAPVALNIMPTSTPGGTWYDSARVNVATYIDAAGLFDPGAAVAGINKVIYVTSGTCPKEDTLAIPVVGEIIVDVLDAPADIDFCANEPLFDLTTYLEPATTSDADQWVVYPVGGGGTIPAGIVGTNELDPTALTPGSYWVKYVIQPPGSTCGDSDSVVININAIPNPTFTTGIAGPICNDAGDQNMILDGAADGGGAWTLTGPAGSSIDPATGVVSLGDSGTYEVTYTVDLAGCAEDSTASFYVESPADPTITAAGPFCEDDADVALVAASAGGAWSSPTGTIDAVTGVFSPAGSGDGTFTINYDFTGTCPVNGTIDITVNPVLDATIAPSDADVCVSAGTYAFTLAPTADPGGVWSSDPVGVIDPVTGELDLVAAVATNGNANTNVAVYYTHPGCGGASPARNILVETPGDPTFSPVGPICKNLGTVSLDNNPDQTGGGTWENLSAPGSIDPITGELDLTLAADGVNEITYTVGGGCPAVWQEDITVNPVPGWSPEAANANGCEPHTTDMYLVLDDPAGSQPVTSTWTVDGVTSVVAGTNNINQTFPNDGDYGYYIRVEFDNGCIDSLGAANGLVRVNPVPTAMFDWGPKNATVIEPFIQFENLSVDGDEFDWELGRVSNSTGVGPTPNTSNEVNPSAIYSAPDSGWYDVTLIATNGECRDTFVDRVFILDNFTAFVPNAFTPNADGDNDFFLPLGNTFANPEGLSEYEFLIFNRWGDLIWESNTPYEPWDGTHGRTYSKVQQDVYVWKLKVWDNVDAVLKTYYGRVSLIR